MKYFIDFEFLEGDVPCQIKGFNIPRWLIKPNNTIQPISVGICSSDYREYYAISKDFNLKEAWNRYDLKNVRTQESLENDYIDYENIKVYWLRDNVLKPIFIELRAKEVEEYNIAQRRNVVLDFPEYSFCFREFKRLINKYGKTNKQIAEEIKEFVYIKSFKYNKGNPIIDEKNWIDGKPEFYGYYCDYDWVTLCWLFGKMIDLPTGFPVYCIDLKQELDRYSQNKIYTIDINTIPTNMAIQDYINKYVIKQDVTKHPKYPKQTNKHNALADARWNYQLYKFLNELN